MMPAVNFHFTRLCQFACVGCFHASSSAHVEPLPRLLLAIDALADAGVSKINFAGGEPTLFPDQLTQMLVRAKARGMYTSVITNGIRVDDRFVDEHARVLDMLGVSIDAHTPHMNARIGRQTSRGQQLDLNVLEVARQRCASAGVTFKINTVVNKLNVEADMSVVIDRFLPERWKLFQHLSVAGENDDAGHLCISDIEFQGFVQRHLRYGPIAETNLLMQSSYVLVNERLQVLDTSAGAKTPSSMTVIEDAPRALSHAGFDAANFKLRNGDFYLPSH